MIEEFAVPVFLVITALWLFFHSLQRKRPKGFPPGPRSWRIIGNIIDMGMEPYKSVMEMKKKYGNIIGIDLGMRRSIFINDYKILKEAYRTYAFSGRPAFHHLSYRETGELRGFAFTQGKLWEEQRRIFSNYTQTETKNAATTEKLILREAKQAMEDLKKNIGTPIDMENVFSIPALNIIWCVLTGERFPHGDPNFDVILEHTAKVTKSWRIQGMLVFFPILGKLFPNLSGSNTVRNAMTGMTDVGQRVLDQHKKTYKEGVERDFIDHFLHKIRTTTDKTSSFYGDVAEEHLSATLRDSVLAGTDSVAASLYWLLFLLAHYPQIQQKVIDTIKDGIDVGNWPSLQDRNRMPYIEAVVHELLRYSSLVAMGFFHEMNENVEFHGYKIPKGTVIVANQYGIQHDTTYWTNPDLFMPERFLNDDGTVNRQASSVPFGAGKRVCPGEALARDELFIFTVSIFQNFRVEFDPSQPKPPLQYLPAQFLLPVKHKIVFSNL